MTDVDLRRRGQLAMVIATGMALLLSLADSPYPRGPVVGRETPVIPSPSTRRFAGSSLRI